MKIMGSLAMGLIVMIGTTSFVNAATKCVALNGNSTCSGTTGSARADWESTCNNISVIGMGVCTSTRGLTVGQTTDTVTVSGTANDNIYCWCRMISPFVSKYVYATSGNVGYCMYGCASFCSSSLSNSAFRSGMFGNNSVGPTPTVPTR